MGTTEYILELKNISKSFPGVKALDNVKLQVKPGSVHALIGENGAGKSTLMKIINGAHQANSGEIFYKGLKVAPENQKQMIELGISTIYQELSPLNEMTIAENIFLGQEPMTKYGFVDFNKMNENAKELLEKLRLNYDPTTKMKELTISEMQLVEVAKAISKNASLIIMDEPTSSITEGEVQILFQIIRDLQSKGVSVIYISHKLEEIFDICDTITVFRDGKYIVTEDIKDMTKNKMIALMVGREIEDVYPNVPHETQGKILAVENLTKKGKFKDVSFTLNKGEIVGFAGLVGAGRSEVFRTIFGIDKLDTGTITYNDKTVQIQSVKDAIKLGIVMASEDRKKDGVVLCRSIKENISLTNIEKILTSQFISDKKELDLVTDISKRLGIKAPTLETLCQNLSGGNQQKVVLAKWLLTEPKILILDEPTRGIDVGVKYEIYKLIGEIAQTGVSVVVISSELPEIMGVCDRVIVMSNGKVTGEMKKEQFSQEEIMKLAVRGFENEYAN